MCVNEFLDLQLWDTFVSELRDDWNASITPVRPRPVFASIVFSQAIAPPVCIVGHGYSDN